MSKVVIPTESSCMSYPEVYPGADRWLWSDNPIVKGGTVLVTEHGLRRLLRLIRRTQDVIGYEKHRALESHGIENIYKDAVEPTKIQDMLNESCAIFCEGNLVMSRLFVTPDGSIVAHRDKEVDDAGIPPNPTSPEAAR